MKVRTSTWIGVAVVLAAVVDQSAWAEGQRPSQRTLSEMGLGGLVVMSDEDAMAVRGHGYQGNGNSSAVAFGNSFATFTSPFGTSHSENGYAAEGSKFASGKNYSEAGLEIRRSHGQKGRKPGGGMGGKGRGGKWGRNMNGRPGGGYPGGGHHGGGNHGGGNHGGSGIKFSVRVFAGGFSSASAR